MKLSRAIIPLVIVLLLSCAASADSFTFNFQTYQDPRLNPPATVISGHGTFQASPTTGLPCFFAGFGMLAITSLQGSMNVAGQGTGPLDIIGGPCDNWVTSTGQISASIFFNQLHLLFQGDTWTITHADVTNPWQFFLQDTANTDIGGPLTLDIEPVPAPEGASLPLLLVGAGSALALMRKKLLKT
jgi:hypothetical protein